MNAQELLVALLNADRLEQVRALLEEFSSERGVAWLPVGGRANNSGTIQAAGDPARALVERVTNGLDAVLDRAWHDHKGQPECKSPRDAAQAWFGVPVGGLHKMSEAERRSLAGQAVTVTLLEGDGRAKRTIDVADHGRGLTAEEIPKTILSLNSDNKLDKYHTAGAFGQGGSATFASCEYTLVASRKVGGDDVAFTVVRYEPPRGLKLGSYVFLVVDGLVPTTKVVSEFGEFSTRVRHYGYDLDDYAAKLGPNSLYGRLQSVMFDPVLPFTLDTRVHNFRRTMKGVRSALYGASEEDEAASKLSHSIPLFFTDLGDFGQVGIEYWVLEPNPKGAAPNRAFVNGAKPIILTVNGQTHAEWTANIIRKDADLLHLTSRMVVHIDCNKLSGDAKRVLFVSNREESRKGVVQNLILNELLSALKTDDVLAKLNDDARNASIKQQDASAAQEMRTEVAKMLRLFGFNAEIGSSEATPSKRGKGDTSSGVNSSRGGGGQRSPQPIPATEPPTFVKMLGSTITFFPGQRRYVRLRTDANSKYHDARDPAKSFFRMLADKPIRVVGTTDLKEGHMRVIFAAEDAAEVGTSGKLLVELRPPTSATLSDSTAFEIIKKPEAPAAPSKLSVPRIDCQPIHEIGEEWSNLGWPDNPEETAADYLFTNEGTLQIRYSTLFPRYRDTVKELELKDAALARSFEARYQIWTITNALIHWQDEKADATPLSAEELPKEKLDDFRRDELRRMAKVAALVARREIEQAKNAEKEE